MNYMVIVGNIGIVYEGKSKAEALRTYHEYVSQSVKGCGRASGENVTLLTNNEIDKEYFGR